MLTPPGSSGVGMAPKASRLGLWEVISAQREDSGGRSGDWRLGQGQPGQRQEAGASGGVQGTRQVALAGEVPVIPEAGEAGMREPHPFSGDTPSVRRP